MLRLSISKNTKTLIVIMTIILFVFLASGIAFIYIIPPFENPDESEHLGYVYHIAKERKLPHVIPGGSGTFNQEGYQPPFYYLSCVPFALLSDLNFKPLKPPRNKRFRFVPVPPRKGEHRLFQVIKADSPSRIRATAKLCIRLRWMSLLWGLSVGTLGAKLLWRLSQQSIAVTSIGVALFMLNPRWIETCAAVSNDVAATFMATFIVVLLVEMIHKDRCHSLPWVILLSTSCAIATLTKLSTSGLILISALVLICCPSRRSVPIQKRILIQGLFWAVVIGLVFPWVWRNQVLYGDPFTFNSFISAPSAAIRKNPLGPLAFFAEEFQGFRWSYWAVFGQFGVLAHRFIYWILDSLMIIGGVLGTVFFVSSVKKGKTLSQQLPYVIPALWIATLFISFLRYNYYVLASQGRYMFPAGICLSFFLSGGIVMFFPKKNQGYVTGFILLSMAILVIYSIFFVLVPAYST